MFGFDELKEKIEIQKDTIECPVIGCKNRVKKMTNRDLKLLDSYLENKNRDEWKGKKEDFTTCYCKNHKIYITPTTFIYKDLRDNLLWYDEDKALLNKIIEVKRFKAQLHHDKSEDSVTWNVFRFLERNNLVEIILSSIICVSLKSSEILYWSYSQKENSSWSELSKARKEFGEEIKRSSEPDIIIKTNNALLFIEAKFDTRNKQGPSDKSNSKKYETGGGNWFSKVFKSDYKTVAKDKNKYQLVRFWLLGTWIANQLDLDFYLVNLVLSEREKNIETIFKRHIYENQRKKFIRITWEDIYYQILNSDLSGIDKDTMIKYFKNKTIGYVNGKLQRAFSIL